MAHKLHNSIYSAVEEIKAAEKITKARLRDLSRDMLTYVPETDDIEIVNRLIGVLTPVNRKVAILYFAAFLPWVEEKDGDGKHVRFGKRMKGDKKIKAKMDAIREWLADESNDIWSWGEDNIEVKQKDFKGTVARAIKSALEGDEKTGTPPLSREDLMAAILEGGVTLEDMFSSIERMTETEQEAESNYLSEDEKENA